MMKDGNVWLDLDIRNWEPEVFKLSLSIRCLPASLAYSDDQIYRLLLVSLVKATLFVVVLSFAMSG